MRLAHDLLRDDGEDEPVTDHDSLHARVSRRGKRWHRINRLLSAGVGALAVGAAIVLGVTAPDTSPVQPAAAPAAAAPAPGTDQGATDPAPDAVDRGRDGDRGGRDRMVGFHRHGR